MKIIQRIGILFFLVVFLFGTTGISIFEHICTCQDKTEVTLFPEIFTHHSSCCCSEGEVELVTPDHAHLIGLEKPNHCKNIKFFIKATVTPVPVVMNLFTFLDLAAPGCLLHLDIFPVYDRPVDDGVMHYCTSPPISGRQRIIALHQTKIPALPISLV
jgi:hypothetical protein